MDGGGESELIDSINDLDESEVKEYSKAFYYENSTIINPYIKFFDRIISFDGSSILSIFFPFKVFDRKNCLKIPCDIKFGHKNLLIPIEFVCLMDAILSKNTNVEGLFRINPKFETKLKGINDLDIAVEKNYKKEQIMKILNEYDIHTLTAIYKNSFKKYDDCVIPNRFIKFILRLESVDDIYTKIKISHFLIAALPIENRHMLEATMRFLDLIIESNKPSPSSKKEECKKLDLRGISIVIMPNLFLTENLKVEINDIHRLVDYCEFLIRNCKFVISIFKLNE